MKNKGSYGIGREKFLDRQQRKQLMKVCQDRSELDILHGRRTWVVRFMLIDLALFTGLRVSEIAQLELSDIFLKSQTPHIQAVETNLHTKQEPPEKSGGFYSFNLFTNGW